MSERRDSAADSATCEARILVADDAWFQRLKLRDILAGSGRYQVAGEASNGEEAVRLYFEQRPDLLLMDVGLPVLDGIEATRRILAADPEARIVILSDRGEEALVTEAMAAGARDLVTKPLERSTVLRVLDHLLPPEAQRE